MATPAYNELYLSDAMKTLAHFVDYSIHECGFDPDKLEWKVHLDGVIR